MKIMFDEEAVIFCIEFGDYSGILIFEAPVVDGDNRRGCIGEYRLQGNVNPDGFMTSVESVGMQVASPCCEDALGGKYTIYCGVASDEISSYCDDN